MNPEIQAKVILWRQKAVAGTLTQEEMAEAVKVLREGRIAAQMAVTTGKAKTAAGKAPAVSGNDLLDELMG